MSLTYTNTITVDEVNLIRASVGFRQNHPEQVKSGLNGSAFIIAAYEQNKAAGMARLLWDGGGTAMISDLIVVPEHHNKGIESELITHIFDFLRVKLKPGFGIQVDIKAWNNQKMLLEEFGFQTSMTQKRGIPMHICLTNQIELTDKMFKQMEFEGN